MSEKLDRGRQQSVLIPEYFAKILKNKDRIIRVQARRIELLEEEVHRLRMGREAMSSQLAILSCKLKVLTARNEESSYGNDSRISPLYSHQPNHQAMETRQFEKSSDLHKGNRNISTDSRPNNNGSNHLITFYGNRDVELLERKYGDYTRANRAALKIQHMYRQYSLNRNFQKLRLEVGDSSRRSRRFNKLVAEQNMKSTPEASDRLATTNENIVLGRFPNQNGGIPRQNSHSPNTGRVSAAVDRRSDRKDVSNFHSGRENISPLGTPAAINVDPPNFSLETLLEYRSKNPPPFHEDGKKDGNWSSSSSSPKVSTPVDLLPALTYVNEEQRVKDSVDIDDTAITFEAKEIYRDSNLQQRTVTSAISCDYDSVFVSVPNGPLRGHSSSQVDGNCIGHHRQNKPSSGPSSNSSKSSDFSNPGANTHHHKHPTKYAHACHHVGSNPSCQKPHLVHLDSETPEPLPISRIHHTDNPKFEAADVEITPSGSSHELRASSSSSDVASLGSNNEFKIPSSGGFNSEISSGEFDLYVQRNVSHLNDRTRKRKYRIGLNLFNRKPEKGVRFLIENHFLDNRPREVAHFLLTRKGLSKQMIGEYLGNLLQQFNMEVLECFVNEMDFTGIPIDKALRKFQSHFRLPGEAQKIEKLMEAFASSYITSNPDVVRKFAHPDTVFLIAYAIIMLNTDLHNNNIKPDRKMKLQDFIRNLRGIDGGEDVDPELLTGIFDRIALYPLKSANDHVVQVMKVEKMILGKKPVLPEPHRRLICYCRLYEVKDPNKREKSNMHQREVFLFNDLLLITKLNNKKKDALLYNYRESFHLFGMMMVLFELPHYKHGVQLTSNLDNRVLITLCASNEADRIKFVEDLNEAIIEVNEMEAIRVQEEFAAQDLSSRNFPDVLRRSKDSGGAPDQNPNRLSVGIVENRLSAPDCTALNKTSLSSSNGDVIDGRNRLSSGSLDSGLPSVNSGSSNNSFQVQDKSVQKTRDASKFNIFTRKPRTSKSSSTEPS